MKHPYWLVIIWLIVLICSMWLLNVEQPQFDTIEELFWAAISVSLTLQVYSYLSNKLLIYAWVLYCSGLLLDLLDDIIDTQLFPLLIFDTTLKNSGFLLTCTALLLLIKEKRTTISSLNDEIQTRQALQEQLEYDASHDKLTGLGNRRACFARFEQLQQQYQRIFYFDLDNFKYANDHYGHRQGDLILLDFAVRLSEQFDAQNCFRLGGDEFVAFFNEDTPDIQHLRQQLTSMIKTYQVGVSIGFADLNSDSHPDQILHMADQKMYRDKKCKSMRNTSRTPPP